MSTRIRKSKKVGPFRFTVTPNGVSTSAGVNGARVSLGSDGRVRRTIGIPGSGISNTAVVGRLGGSEDAPAPDSREASLASLGLLVTETEEGASVAFAPDIRPSFKAIRALGQLGADNDAVKLAIAEWWSDHDAATQPVRWNPLSSDSSPNRAIRARRLAKLRAKAGA